MGITIFAHGTIDRLEEIPHLIEEVRGMAQKNGWACSVVNDDFDVEPAARLIRQSGDKPAVIKGSLGLKGVVLSVDPKCESLGILFDRSGALISVMQQLFRFSGDIPLQPFTACKTQFGCIESHIKIVELLHALKKKFISDLTVNDEGEYWESGDVERLSNKRDVLNHYMDHAKNVIAGIKLTDEESLSADSIGSRIEQALLQTEEDKIFH